LANIETYSESIKQDPSVPTLDLAWVEALDSILREWLSDARVMLVCGDFRHGSVSELLPEGRASLSRPKYNGIFAGLRDVAIEGERHHMHVDLGRVEVVRYAVRPSVCFGFRPSLDIEFMSRTERAFALSVDRLYVKTSIDPAACARFVQRYLRHRQAHGERVAFAIEYPAQDAAPAYDVLLDAIEGEARHDTEAADLARKLWAQTRETREQMAPT